MCLFSNSGFTAQLTYCVTFIGYQYISGDVQGGVTVFPIVQVRPTSIPSTGIIHDTYQPAISDHLTVTDWTNHRPRLLLANDASVTMCRTSGTLFRRLSDPLTVTTPSRPQKSLICLTLSDVEEHSATDPCPDSEFLFIEMGTLKFYDWLIILRRLAGSSYTPRHLYRDVDVAPPNRMFYLTFL